MAAITPIAIPDEDAARVLGLNADAHERALLRRKGEFPPCFYIGGHALVLVSDIDTFIAERKAAAETIRAARSAKMSRAVNARWAKHRAAKAAAASQSSEAA